MLNLLIYFLKKDLKTRYAGAGLGLLWAFLLPLFQILLFWFVFSIIMKARPYGSAKISYIYFLLSSFFFWLAFAEGLGRSASIIVENAEIVKKVSFPHEILPVTATLSSYINNLIGFVIFIVFYAVTTSFHPLLFLIIPVLLTQIAFSVGIGMIFSSLVPYMRDLTQVLGYILQGMFFLSPIMYSIDSLPQKFRMLISLNPITYFATAYQNIILLQKPPALSYLIIIVFLAFFAITAGFFVFRKLRDGFADVL
jgi:ABC-type polysaccharide/polyol phosphate export permease